MSLEIGSKLGPHEILEPLGKGGMGEVYLAEDSRLRRNVAIKVLPAEFAADPERLARFEQEARAAAGLNHPHIAVVHDVGSEADAGGETIHYIVQEYLEGEPLRALLEKGPPPTKKALTLAIEVVEAIGAAHAAGIVHRDLKPDNVFVTRDGHAKVLDFGLAKLTEIAAPGGTEHSMSPTVLGTVAGQVMGTAGYMSPEQIEGDAEIDGRSDIFAFGCVLYEMTVGKRAFGGGSVLDTLHAIARTDPEPVSELRPDAPSELGRILQKCLAKEREERYQHAEDLLVDLRGLAGEVDAGTALSFAEGSAVAAAAPTTGRLASWIAAGVVAGAALGWLLAGVVSRPGPTADSGVARFRIQVSESTLDPGFGSAVILSPDGQTLAYSALDGLWIRPLGTLEGRRLVEESVDNPVFSPDGQWLAYEQGGTLWRVPVTGGSPLAITEAPADRGTSWGEADAILLSPENSGPIVRAPIDGDGEPEPMTELTGDDVTHRWPQLLPGGHALLFIAHTRSGGFDNATIMVRDLRTGEQRVLFRGGTYARYVPSGHLVYANNNAVFAAAFDLEELTVIGSSAPVLEDVHMGTQHGGAHFHFADNGSLVVVPAVGQMSEIATWVFLDGDGAVGQEWSPGGFSYSPVLSPDGTRLVATVIGGESQNLWSWDRERAAPTRITFSQGNDLSAVWLPGGRELIYASNAEGVFRLYRIRADGSGEGQPLPDPVDVGEFPGAVSADGRWLLTRQDHPEGRSLWVRDLTGDEAPQLVVESEGTIANADLSPDAGWITYSSDETGEWEVYAVPFQAQAGEKIGVSVGGGGMPHWSADGRRIIYRSPAGVSAVDLEAVDGRLRPTAPQLLVEGTFFGGVVGYPFGLAGLSNFEPARDGETFVLQRAPGSGNAQTNAIFVLNWFEELERLVPTDR